MKTATNTLLGTALIAGLSACAASESKIQTAAALSQNLMLQAQNQLMNGNLGESEKSYLSAETSFDTGDKAYLDGKLYARHASAIGNRGMIELRRGDQKSAKVLFDESADLFSKGVRNHRALVKDRAETRETVTMLAGLGAMVGATAFALDGADVGAMSGTEFDAFSNELFSNLETIEELTNSISEIVGEPQDIRVSKEADKVDSDYFRAAVISDDPIIAATTRVQVKSSKGTSGCTGFYVSPHLIVTAGHCFGEGAYGAKVKSAAMNDPDTFLDEKGVALGSAPHRVSNYDPKKRAGSNNDIALLYADERSSHWLDISLEDPVKADGKGMVIGYSGDLDKGYFLRLDYGCDFLKSRFAESHTTNCTSWKGNSGGPVILDRGQTASPQFVVVGLTAFGKVKKFTSRENVYEGATKLSLLEPLLKQVTKSTTWPTLAKAEASDLLSKYYSGDVETATAPAPPALNSPTSIQ